MADVDGGLVPGDVVELAVDLRLRHRVQGRRGLIQNDEGGILIEGPGDGDLLGLAAGDLHALLVQVLVEVGFQALRQGRQPLPEARFGKAVRRPLPVIVPPGSHILPQGQGQQLEILKDHGEEVHVLPVAVLPDVDAIEEDLSLRWIVEPTEELDEGGLSAAVGAHHGKAAPHPEAHVHMPQGVVRPAGVAEGHVPELDVILPVRALLRGEAPLVHAVGDVQKFEEPLQEGAVAPDIHRRLE